MQRLDTPFPVHLLNSTFDQFASEAGRSPPNEQRDLITKDIKDDESDLESSCDRSPEEEETGAHKKTSVSPTQKKKHTMVSSHRFRTDSMVIVYRKRVEMEILESEEVYRAQIKLLHNVTFSLPV